MVEGLHRGIAGRLPYAAKGAVLLPLEHPGDERPLVPAGAGGGIQHPVAGGQMHAA